MVMLSAGKLIVTKSMLTIFSNRCPLDPATVIIYNKHYRVLGGGASLPQIYQAPEILILPW